MAAADATTVARQTIDAQATMEAAGSVTTVARQTANELETAIAQGTEGATASWRSRW